MEWGYSVTEDGAVDGWCRFYPAVSHLATSKMCVAVLGNMGFASALMGYKLLTKVFLGQLRDYEVERVNDRVGQAIIETLLAMTIFRQDFTVYLVSQFVLLAFMKIVHWLAQDRVDFIETTPNVTLSQHVKLASLLILLAGTDLRFLRFCLDKTLTYGVSIHLLFAFEYSVLTSMTVAIMFKYAFSLVDLAHNGTWRAKSVAVFYVDLTRDLVHLTTYFAFFVVVFSTYGIPIHLIRDIYWTFRNFQMRVRDFLRFRQIAANMENRFPDATEEDLARSDHMCIVCREEMGSGSRAKRLPCGHVFHFECLKSWLERQQNCPICRTAIPSSAPAAAAVPPPAAAAAPEPAQPHDNDGQPARPQENRQDVSQNNDVEPQQQDADGQARADARKERLEFLRRLEEEYTSRLGADNQEAGPSSSSEPTAGYTKIDKGKQPVSETDRVTSVSEQPDPDQETNAWPSMQWIPAPSMAMFIPAASQSMQYAAQQAPIVDHQDGYMQALVPAITVPVMFPVAAQAVPAGAIDEAALRRSMLDTGLEISDEQHARALAIAHAAAQAAISANAFTLPVYSPGSMPENSTGQHQQSSNNTGQRYQSTNNNQ